jgi:hypothetical protein
MSGHGKGFAFSSEAALSFLVLLSAAAFLPLFSLHSSGEEKFALCSDAAGVLMKSGAFQSQSALSASVGEAGGLSGMCVSAGAGGFFSSSCAAGKAPHRISLSFPVFSGGRVQKAEVACWEAEPYD